MESTVMFLAQLSLTKVKGSQQRKKGEREQHCSERKDTVCVATVRHSVLTVNCKDPYLLKLAHTHVHMH